MKIIWNFKLVSFLELLQGFRLNSFEFLTSICLEFD
jgi:hypothetical protein